MYLGRGLLLAKMHLDHLKWCGHNFFMWWPKRVNLWMCFMSSSYKTFIRAKFIYLFIFAPHKKLHVTLTYIMTRAVNLFHQECQKQLSFFNDARGLHWYKCLTNGWNKISRLRIEWAEGISFCNSRRVLTASISHEGFIRARTFRLTNAFL